MRTSQLWFELLVGLLLSGFCVRSSLAQGPQISKPINQQQQQQQQQQQKSPSEQRELVNTVRVICHPDSLEILIQADMFAVGAPVHVADLRLGVEHHDFCMATAPSAEEYRIIVGLLDCGTRHWMTDDALVYTNLLIYSPQASPDGLIRMDEAVIPIECHYERKYSLSSSSLSPTWIPFTSTQAAVETLEFDLKLMTNDWMYERSSNVFYLGDQISMEASVRVGHHMGLRVFVSSCVATLYPDIHSVPRYIFIENGCLVDSQLPGSKSHFLPRIQDDKLHLTIDAFRFHDEERGQLYITCHLTAVPVNDAEAPNKACTLVGGRWRSADGNDYLCGQCNSQNEAGQGHGKPSSQGKFGPRGFGKPEQTEAFRKSAVAANIVWEQEARVGPVLVLPGKAKTGPLPEEALPPVLSKISRPSLYGSQWRSGLSDRRVDEKKGLLPEPSTADEEETKDVEAEPKDDYEETEELAAVEKITLKSNAADVNTNITAAISDVGPTSLPLDVAEQRNMTEPELSHAVEPKRK